MNLIDKIESILKAKGITAYKLEKDTGIKQTTYQGWKRGSQPAADKIQILIQYLEVSPNELFGYDQSKDLLTENQKRMIEIMETMDEAHQMGAIGIIEDYADRHPKQLEKSSISRTG